MVSSSMLPYSSYWMCPTQHCALREGLSSAAALTFACFGSYVAKSLDLTKGYRFSSLAQSLLEIINADEEAAEALQTITEAKMFTEPAQAANEFRLQVFRAAMKAGNTNYAGYSKLLYCSGSLWAGTHLALVNEVSNSFEALFLLYITIVPTIVFSVDLKSWHLFHAK